MPRGCRRCIKEDVCVALVNSPFLTSPKFLVYHSEKNFGSYVFKEKKSAPKKETLSQKSRSASASARKQTNDRTAADTTNATHGSRKTRHKARGPGRQSAQRPRRSGSIGSSPSQKDGRRESRTQSASADNGTGAGPDGGGSRDQTTQPANGPDGRTRRTNTEAPQARPGTECAPAAKDPAARILESELARML